MPSSISTSLPTAWCSPGLGGEPLAAPHRPWLIIDTETTGLDPGRDQITEFAALVMDDDLKTRTARRWVRQDGPLVLEECVEALGRVARVGTVVAHNLAFDLAFLQAQRATSGSPLVRPARWLCTMRLTGARTSLASLAQALGVEAVDLHTAAGDSRTLAVVLSRLITAAKSRGLTNVAGVAAVAPVGKVARSEPAVAMDGWLQVRAELDHVAPFRPVTLEQRLAFTQERCHPAARATAAGRLRAVGITTLAFDQLLTAFEQPVSGAEPDAPE